MPLPRGTAFTNCFLDSSWTDRRVLPSHHPGETLGSNPRIRASRWIPHWPLLSSQLYKLGVWLESKESVPLVTNWPMGKDNSYFVNYPNTGLDHIFLWLLPICTQHVLMIIYLSAFNGILGVINRSCFGWAPDGKSEGCISYFCSASVQLWHTHPNLREMNDGCVV